MELDHFQIGWSLLMAHKFKFSYFSRSSVGGVPHPLGYLSQSCICIFLPLRLWLYLFIYCFITTLNIYFSVALKSVCHVGAMMIKVV